MLTWLERRTPFPPADQALAEPNGLLAAGGDLSVERLLDAYRQGIFPWYSAHEPILWWSPDPRMVLEPDGLRISRSFAKVLRNRPWEVRFDTVFDSVTAACAAPRPGQAGTWITAEMRAAYGELHRRGWAHSVETWIDGELAGGLYGVAIGAVFFGESMFSRRPDASKISLAILAQRLRSLDYGLIDCQVRTHHLASLGAREIPRAAFLRRLTGLINYPVKPGPWNGMAVRNPPCRD